VQNVKRKAKNDNGKCKTWIPASFVCAPFDKLRTSMVNRAGAPGMTVGQKKGPAEKQGLFGNGKPFVKDLFKEVVSARNRSYIYTVMR